MTKQITEPFKGLFTQGMVCHETYKDKNNNWLSPDEITTEDNKIFYMKADPNSVVTVGPSGQCLNQKNTIDPEEMIKIYGADAVRFYII